MFNLSVSCEPTVSTNFRQYLVFLTNLTCSGELSIFLRTGVTTWVCCSSKHKSCWYWSIKPLSAGTVPWKPSIKTPRWLTSCGRAARSGKCAHHSRTGDSKSELKAIIIQVFSGTMTIIGNERKAFNALATASIGANGKWQSVNWLHRISILGGHFKQPRLTHQLGLP